jgi:hypothetical protein
MLFLFISVLISVWVEEEYPRLLRDLQKCHRLKKENDSAAAAVASKPTPTKEAKANAVREQYELQLRMCKIEMEKTKKIRKHHTNCLKIMASLHVSCLKELFDYYFSIITQRPFWKRLKWLKLS